MYVTSPKFNEALVNYITYTLGGKQVADSDLQRRYSDFVALRDKMLERWPGIFIPALPPKKTIGNTDPKNIESRMRLLNEFCFKLSKFSYLIQSEEVNVFMTARNDVAKAIEKIKKEDYPQLRERYQNAFSNYYENYDIIRGKGKMTEITSFVKRAMKNMKAFHETITIAFDRYEKTMERYIAMLKCMEEYESTSLIEYADNNNEKLVFCNGDKANVMERIEQLKVTLLNPFRFLVEWIEGEEQDLQAMLNALDGLIGLNATLDKFTHKVDEIDRDLQNKTYEKKGFLKLFNKEKYSKEHMEKEKEKYQNNIECLDMISKIAHCNMESQFEVFKKEKVKDYYKSVKLFAATQRGNNKFLEDLWKDIKNTLETIKEKKMIEQGKKEEVPQQQDQQDQDEQ